VTLTMRAIWAIAGFALATALGILLDGSPVRAQASPAIATTIAPPPRAQLQPPRRVAPPPVVEEPAPAAAEEADPEAADPDAGPDVSDDPDQPRRLSGGQRRALRDGDFLAVPGQGGPADGIAGIGEPAALLDRTDPTLVDSRTAEDIAAFENPPSDFDPRLFDAELEPILDRRPAQLFRFEPYTPKGIKVATFVLLPEIEMAGAHLSNVFRDTNARSDRAFELRPAVRLVSDWRKHALELRAVGFASFYDDFTTENDRAYRLETRGRLDITRRTSIEGLLSREVAQESRSSIDTVQGAGRRNDVTTERAAATLNHRFNRLSVQLRGAVTDVSYGDAQAAGGGVIANSRRDYKVYEEAVRASWELKPTLSTFVEAGLNQRDHAAIASADGFRRDSTGERYRVGVSFGNTGQRIRGEVSVGYAHQRPDERQLEDIDGVIIDANLAYRFSALTSFLLTARSDVTETTVVGSPGALTRQIGLEARHAFLRQLIGTAGLSYTVQDYAGVDLEERELRAALGLEYFVNSDVTVFGNYLHTAFNSSQPGRSYDADEVRVGLRLRR